MYETNDIDLSLFWEIPKRVDSAVPIRRGHHYIIGINLAVPQNPFQGKLLSKPTPRVMFEATAKERLQLVNSLTRNRAFKDESPVKIMVKCHDYHKHDFSEEGWVSTIFHFVLKCISRLPDPYGLQIGHYPHYSVTKELLVEQNGCVYLRTPFINRLASFAIC